MLNKEVQKALNDFAKYVIQQSRSNLTKNKKNASGDLYKSLDSSVDPTPKGYTLTFEMEDYADFVDLGVKGTKSNYLENSRSPFSYKSKGGKRGLKGMPPPKAFDKWIVRKGIAPRDKSGKFLSRKTLKFLIAKSIFEKGIKASMFFTKPFERAFKRLPDELLEAYSIKVEQEINVNLNEK